MTRQQLVDQTIRSGVRPLDLRFQPISHPFTRFPIAYRTSTAVFSVSRGVLTEREYAYAADFGNPTGVRLAKWNIREGLRAVRAFADAGRKIDFLSVRCPASLAGVPDLYEQVRAILAEKDADPAKLCLEFPQSLLYLAGREAGDAIRALRLLGLKTLLSGCGAADCPVTQLVHVPVDFVLLDESTTSLVHNRDKEGVLPQFIRYLQTLHVGVYAEGVTDDEQITSLNRLDCLGVIPARTYRGNLPYAAGNLPTEEAIRQREEAGKVE